LVLRTKDLDWDFICIFCVLTPDKSLALPIQSTKDFHQHGIDYKSRGNIILKNERKEILIATDYFINNQSDDIDLDVQSLFIDKSDVDASKELKERLRQSNALCTRRNGCCSFSSYYSFTTVL
jgi:hypothetical protein